MSPADIELSASEELSGLPCGCYLERACDGNIAFHYCDTHRRATRERVPVDPERSARATDAVRACASSRDAFTTDDVWAALDGTPAPPDPRCLGTVMRSAASAGLIERTDQLRPSKFAARRGGRHVRVWHSIIKR